MCMENELHKGVIKFAYIGKIYIYGGIDQNSL